MGDAAGGPTFRDEVDNDVEQLQALLGTDGDIVQNREPLEEYLRDGHGSESYGILRTLYGKLPAKDLPRVGLLSLTLSFIIGGFWLLDSLKDAIIERILGLEYQPKAKLLSVAITLLLVVFYSKLVDTVRKPVLFYILGFIYTSLLFILSKILEKLENESNMSSDSTLARGAGWTSYVVIESYGSLFVALFWAFVNSAGNLEEAKASYGLIIAGAQVGAILGSTAATLAGPKVPLNKLFLVGALSPLLTAIMVFLYGKLYGDHLPREVSREAKDALKEDASIEEFKDKKFELSGALDGLRLTFRYRFVTMILGISCLYEIALTVLDYQMKVMGVAKFRAAALTAELFGGDFEVSSSGTGIKDSTSAGFAVLMGRFGQVTNGLSLLLSLLGTSLIVRKLGLPFTLTVFPALLVLAIVVSYFHPSLWVLFVAVSALKGLTYALNEPCKEMLYMVTSDSIKFKSKAWIDVFGSRCAKGIGSLITGSSDGNHDALVTYGSFTIFIVSLALLGLSLVVGQEFKQLVRSGKIIGESNQLRTVSCTDKTLLGFEKMEDFEENGIEMK